LVLIASGATTLVKFSIDASRNRADPGAA
jgi:hypothetical protein